MSSPGSVSLAMWQPAKPPDERDPFAVVTWAVERFRQREIAMTTSFGMEGVALLDIVSQRCPEIRVIYVDTGFLFPETHELRERLAQRYPKARFEAVHPRLSADEQAGEFGAELWKRDPDSCCRMRKVEPLDRAIRGVDVWFAALRRSQAATRLELKIVDWDWQYQLIKVCPLASWSRREVYDYVKHRELPYNVLHDRSYPTIGCTHCTRPVEGSNPWDYSREGRWTNTSKTECGLHGAGI